MDQYGNSNQGKAKIEPVIEEAVFLINNESKDDPVNWFNGKGKVYGKCGYFF